MAMLGATQHSQTKYIAHSEEVMALCLPWLTLSCIPEVMYLVNDYVDVKVQGVAEMPFILYPSSDWCSDQSDGRELRCQREMAFKS